MRNLLRGAGLAIRGIGYVIGYALRGLWIGGKNAICFALMPWTTARFWSELSKTNDKDVVGFCVPCAYSIVFGMVILGTFAFAFLASSAYPNGLPLKQTLLFQIWYITLPLIAGNIFSGLYELGRAYAPSGTASQVSSTQKPQEDGMEPPNPWPKPVQAPKRGDKVQAYADPKNAYEHEINGLRKAIDEDDGKIRFWKWLAIGTLTVVILAGAVTGYALHKGILVVEVDGVSMAQELEKAQAEVERLKGEIPALEDAQKKLDEMMKRAKEMVPPGILPSEKDKKDDF